MLVQVQHGLVLQASHLDGMNTATAAPGICVVLDSAQGVPTHLIGRHVVCGGGPRV